MPPWSKKAALTGHWVKVTAGAMQGPGTVLAVLKTVPLLGTGYGALLKVYLGKGVEPH